MKTVDGKLGQVPVKIEVDDRTYVSVDREHAALRTMLDDAQTALGDLTGRVVRDRYPEARIRYAQAIATLAIGEAMLTLFNRLETITERMDATNEVLGEVSQFAALTDVIDGLTGAITDHHKEP